MHALYQAQVCYSILEYYKNVSSLTMLLSSARILCSYSVHLGCILCYAEANVHGCTQCKLKPCFKHDAHRLKAIMHAHQLSLSMTDLND